MQHVQHVLAYARALADRLELDMRWEGSEYGGGFWAANEPQCAPRIAARAASALEFFRQYAGTDSYWTQRAHAVYNNGGNSQSPETGARSLGELLRAWAEQIEGGIIEIAGARAWAGVEVASTDLMSQVRRLNEDRSAHPAAAIVLSGAALEIALRAVVNARDLMVEGRTSIAAYVHALRRADLITAQDVKDFDQCAGMRNLAAHGDFDGLSRERAGLLEQQVNLLLRKIAELQ